MGGRAGQPVEKVHDVRGKAHAHGHVGAGIFQDQIPADDPRDQLAHGGVGVGVGRTRNGDHGREFGITEAGQRADNGDQHQRKRDRRPRSRAARQRGVVNDVVGQRRVQNAGSVELLPEIAVPMTVKMPEPITAPMPSAVSDHGPRVFFNACSGSSESRISLSMDLRASSWLGRAVLLIPSLAIL